MSYPFKICDPVHGFIRFAEFEKEVIDSRPFQRLRYIHQMGVAYLVYPGARHSRFEHSLGVMELATRIYNTLISSHNKLLNLDLTVEELEYWRLILRLSALCHDMGHLPFSHTAEKSLLPNGGHETMTLAIIHSPELKKIWQMIGENAEKDIADLSVTSSCLGRSSWKKLLSKIITEDSFGADRIDYLLRDSHYTGVGYGYFDYHQLIDSLRILAKDEDLSLGVMHSGIQSVESLWIARYMMFARVYHHPKARAYTNHMHRLMRRLYQNHSDMSLSDYLDFADFSVLATLSHFACQGDYDARCLLKLEPPYRQIALGPEAVQKIKNLEKIFENEVLIDDLPVKEIDPSFFVYSEDGDLISCFEASSFLRDIPRGGNAVCLYVHPEKESLIKQMLNQSESVE